MKKTQSGQILLIVIVFMTIALAVGIGISLRTLSSISRVSDVDTISRVLAVAEGGAEAFLQKSSQELTSLKDICTGNYASGVPAQCVVSYNAGSADDFINAQAVITVQEYTSTSGVSSGSSSSSYFIYTLNISDGSMREVNLKGKKQDLMICWSPADSGAASTPDLYFTVLSDTGVALQKGVSSGSVGKPPTYIANGFENSTSDVTNCEANTNLRTYRLNLAGLNNLTKLRIKSIVGASKVQIYAVNPAGSELPVQGFKIVSVGSLTSSKSSSVAVENVTKRAVVYKPYPYVTGLLDFGMYSTGGLSQ